MARITCRCLQLEDCPIHFVPQNHPELMYLFLADFWRILGSWGFSASWPPHLASYVATRFAKVEGKDTSSSDGQLLSRSSHPCSCSMVKAHGGYMLVMRFSLNERSLPGIPRKQRPSSKSVKTTTSVSISTNLKPFLSPKISFRIAFTETFHAISIARAKGLIPQLLCKNLIGPDVRQEE